MTQYLFAYGTLQPDLAPPEIAPLAAQLRPMGEGSVRGALYDLGGYPGAVPDPMAEGRIAGTVMELPEDETVLRRLDAYEGFDPQAPEESEFVRVRQTVELTSGGTLECWIYVYNGETEIADVIEGGKWGKTVARRAT
jgi:gamma-glutamylcyclotransferase (GGCT)/AIG2-like uncharacterized protein YtfP